MCTTQSHRVIGKQPKQNYRGFISVITIPKYKSPKNLVQWTKKSILSPNSISNFLFGWLKNIKLNQHHSKVMDTVLNFIFGVKLVACKLLFSLFTKVRTLLYFKTMLELCFRKCFWKQLNLPTWHFPFVYRWSESDAAVTWKSLHNLLTVSLSEEIMLCVNPGNFDRKLWQLFEIAN